MTKFEFKTLSYTPGIKTEDFFNDLSDAGEQGFQIVGTVNTGTEKNPNIHVFMQRIKSEEPKKRKGITVRN